MDLTATRPAEIARAFYRAQESGLHGDALRAFWTEDATTTEYPNPINPTGGTTDVEHMVRASSVGAGLLATVEIDVHDEHELDDLAIMRLTWRGTVATARGPFSPGDVITAHVAQFVSTRDGRIASIATYDCYEPFGSPPS
jgi:ketosteroid isomerase-like protein